MDKIKPIPQPESDRYWEGANEKKLLLQKFGDHIQFYPRAVSTKDGSRDVEWIEASGKAKLYTFTIVHQAPHPTFVEEVPYSGDCYIRRGCKYAYENHWNRSKTRKSQNWYGSCYRFYRCRRTKFTSF